jgi:TPP-dependent pyruvate/acetoin dehydrogenase alpha subunit
MALKTKGVRGVAAAFFGDGAASEGDFHVAMTFAGKWKAPVLFLCQNNQWSISVPVTRQTAAPSLAAKAPAYDIESARVDGNDILAVYTAVRDAAAAARSGDGPRFLEFFTYRMAAHSTSDDPSRYRDEEVTRLWEQRDPILVFRRYLESRGLPFEEWEETFTGSFGKELGEIVRRAEEMPPPPHESLFEDVYAETTAALAEQKHEMLEHRKGRSGDE